MKVGELISLLNVFHHISNSDDILVQVDIDGVRKFFNLHDTYKVAVAGRHTPVLVYNQAEVKPDIIKGKIARISTNAEDTWMCAACGGSVGEFDNFCI